jgi:hypothetical protein
MTLNYQNGEIDILVNFRTPVDINQTTGMYDFGASSKTVPTLAWSGLYQLLSVESSFSKGEFHQTLTGNKRPLTDLDGPGSDKGALTTNNAKADPNDPDATGTPKTATTSSAASNGDIASALANGKLTPAQARDAIKAQKAAATQANGG